MKIDGRCHCGYVTFEAEADPEMTTICNCTDCQTMSGAPLRAVITTRPGTFVLLSGKPTEYRKTADSGNVRLQGFCPRCGTALYATSIDDEPKAYNVRLGALRQRNELVPSGRYLFARNRRGSTTSTRFRNSTGRGIDPGPMRCELVCAQQSCCPEVCYRFCPEAWEGPNSEPAFVHHAARWRGWRVAARAARAMR
jgi:hypothetical protein